MKKITTIVILFLALSSLSGCSGIKQKYINKLTDEYLEPVRQEATVYFTSLSEDTAGITPSEVSVDMKYADIKFLKAEKLTFGELLENSYPVFVIDIKSGSGENYNDEEIISIIKEAFSRGLSVNLVFDGITYKEYKIRPEGVFVDEATGMDNGSYHVETQYNIE